MTVPLILLYEVSILLSKMIEKKENIVLNFKKTSDYRGLSLSSKCLTDFEQNVCQESWGSQVGKMFSEFKKAVDGGQKTPTQKR